MSIKIVITVSVSHNGSFTIRSIDYEMLIPYTIVISFSLWSIWPHTVNGLH